LYVVRPTLKRKIEKCAIDDFVSLLFMLVIFPLFNTAELHLSGLIRMASHPDTQKIRIIGFYFENGLHWQFEVEKFLQTAVVDYIFIL